LSELAILRLLLISKRFAEYLIDDEFAIPTWFQRMQEMLNRLSGQLRPTLLIIGDGFYAQAEQLCSLFN